MYDSCGFLSASPHTQKVIYKIGYLVPLAVLRILLLLLPLLFHSYNGTALKFPTLYRFLYLGTLALLLTHMLWLCMLNPMSLEALIPFTNVNHLHELRRIWWMLSLSLLSDACHLVCFGHVRSTAPLQTPPTVYFAVRQYNTDEFSQVMNFMSDIQVRLQLTRDQWNSRLEDFTQRMTHNTTRRHAALTPFRVLLQLYAFQDVFDGKLDQAYDMDEGASMVFFVPQIVSFLLHGALYCSPQLEDWILDKCKRNVYFAHRCYWFLRAWCLEVPVDTQASIETLYLDKPSAPDSTIECGRRKPIANDKLLPEERQVIERLMLRVKECGEVAARARENSGSSETNEYYQSNYSIAVQKGFIPVHPITNEPSKGHMACLSANQRVGFRPSSTRSTFHGETDHFDMTPRFLDALINLADHLNTLPRNNRKAELRRQLKLLECDTLPSNSVYVPVNGSHHRVWRVVADECIAINTKERVPCIIYLEVIDDKGSMHNVKPKGWNLLEQLPRQNPWVVSNGTHGGGQPDETSRTASNGSSHEAYVDESEHEVVEAWKNQKRHPLRRTPFIDVVRETVKGPIEHVKTQMKNFRDRSMSEELQSLTIGESLAGTVLQASITLDESDLESGRRNLLQESSPPDIQRSDSGTSLETLGQWSSPVNKRAVNQEISQNLPEIPSLSVDPKPAVGPRRLSYGSGHDSISNPQFGSVGSVLASPPTSRPLQIVFKENWESKQNRIRKRSAFGDHPGWRLLPLLIKSNDDLRQEQLASQLIFKMASILAREKVSVWLYPYEIIALTDSGGIIEAIPDTISLDSLKRNDPDYAGLGEFFVSHFGEEGSDELADAKANFIESLAAYSIVCYILQIKDRHNGNILLDNRGHIIHIDFGFFFLSSPGKNAGFESAPFKLTRDFMEVMEGPSSSLFRSFRELCIKSFITLRKHCMEIILLVEMLKAGNEELNCFRGRPDDAIQQLRERFRLDLNDRACREYVNALIDDSIENWRTNWYDRYQRYFVGVL